MSQQLRGFEMKESKFPIHPQRAYNKYLAQPIDDLVQSYHSALWIQLQDKIHFNDREQYLKRFYRNSEYKTKIKLLGEYYRYHFQAPRIYIEDIGRIIQANVEQKRAVQFAIVTKQMQAQDSESTTPMNSYRGAEPHQKLIKDVELSYEDFQDRPTKKEKIILQSIDHQNQFNLATKGNDKNKYEHDKAHRALNRVESIHCKGSFLVFKPRAQGNKKIEPQKKKTIQPKYKKPKQQTKNRKTQNSKKQATSKSKVVSKVNSTNNSLASHQGLSRSKSKAQLHIVSSKRFDFQIQKGNPQKCLIEQKNKQPKSSSNSQQNSLVKSLSKKQILADKRSYGNTLSRKASKADIKQENGSLKTQRHKVLNLQTNNKLQKSSQQENDSKNPKSNIISRKPSCGNIQAHQPKKMFTRAIQIKKKNK